MAVAGPGVCALRALSRVTGGADALKDAEIRDSAYRIAQGLRSLFNKPEIIVLLRSGEDDHTGARYSTTRSMAACRQSWTSTSTS